MIKKIFMGAMFICASFAASAEEADHAIHEELRGVLNVLASAINSGDFDKMLPVLSEQVRATPINQEFLASRADVSAYFKKWFGADGYLKKLEISLAPDALTEVSADKSWGVVRGNGVDDFRRFFVALGQLPGGFARGFDLGSCARCGARLGVYLAHVEGSRLKDSKTLRIISLA